jgi:hypothetical protein
LKRNNLVNLNAAGRFDDKTRRFEPRFAHLHPSRCEIIPGRQ